MLRLAADCTVSMQLSRFTVSCNNDSLKCWCVELCHVTIPPPVKFSHLSLWVMSGSKRLVSILCTANGLHENVMAFIKHPAPPPHPQTWIITALCLVAGLWNPGWDKVLKKEQGSLKGECAETHTQKSPSGQAAQPVVQTPTPPPHHLTLAAWGPQQVRMFFCQVSLAWWVACSFAGKWFFTSDFNS